MSQVTGIVVAYRSGDGLVDSVSSILESKGVSTRVVVVNNDPADASPGRLAAHRRRVELVEAGANVGFCRAVNLGLAADDSPYVLLLNPDARIASDYLAGLVAHLEDDPVLASAAGLILREGGRHVDSRGLAMLRGRRPVDIDHGSPDDGLRVGAREVFGVTAAAALYRRSAIDDVALAGEVLPESFFMYLDDVDLAWRLRLRGYRSLVDDTVLAWHGRSAAGDENEMDAGWRRIPSVMRREAQRPDYVRERSWVNQLLMIIRCDDAGSFLRQLPFFVARRTGLELFTLLQHPRLAVRARLRLATLVPAALSERQVIQAFARVPARELAAWLP